MRWLAAMVVSAALMLTAVPNAASDEAAERQAKVAERMAEVERRLIELGDLLREEDSDRAAVLLRALQASRQRLIVADMERLKHMLSRGDFASAEERGREVLAALEEVLELLKEPVDRPRARDLLEARRALAELIRRQRVAAQLVADLPPEKAPSSQAQYGRAAEGQAELAAQLCELLEAVSGMPGAQQLQGALEAMRKAAEALGSQQQSEAARRQEHAKDLMQAAQEALRRAAAREQQRERRERRRQLIRLLGHALEQQRTVTSDTRQIGESVGLASPRTRRLRMRGIATAQGQVAELVQEAVALAKSDATTLVLPQALRQVQADAEAAASWLDAEEGLRMALTLQAEVEGTLEALLSALREEQQADTLSPEGGDATQPQREADRDEQSLLRLGRELKVMRELQTSVLHQTESLDAVSAAERQPLAARLAARQASLARMARQVEQSLTLTEAE